MYRFPIYWFAAIFSWSQPLVHQRAAPMCGNHHGPVLKGSERPGKWWGDPCRATTATGDREAARAGKWSSGGPSGTGKARKDAGHPQCGWDHVRDGSKFSMGAYEWVNNMENYRRIQRNWILAHFSTSCQNCNRFGHEVDKSPPFDTKKFWVIGSFSAGR